MTVTKDQAREIAEAFRKSAKVVIKYREDNFQKISPAEYELLHESSNTLLSVSSFITTVAVGLAIDAMENPATELKNVIGLAQEKIKKIQSVGRIIRCVSSLVDLASCIIAKDPAAIVTSVANLNKQMTEKA